MATTTTPPETHEPPHARPRSPSWRGRSRARKAVVGMIASYVGMGLIVLYCILPFYWMIVSVAA